MGDSSKPDDIYNRVMRDPIMAQRMGDIDTDAADALKGFYDNLDNTKKKLDYIGTQNQFAQRNAPTQFMSDPISVKSDLASGDALTGPKKHSIYDNSENIHNLINQLDDVSQTSQDPYQWAKPYAFNTGKLNADFDRYYSHPLYDKLGYNPFRNNEAVYNEKASWLDDNRRMWGQWLGLTWEGIKPMWGGDTNTEEFNRRLQISQSSKGGVGAFATNLLGNFSYTAGVAASFFVQEAALALATAATGGIAGEVTIPGMAAVGARAAKMFGTAADFASMRRVVEGLKGTNTARQFYNDSRAVKTAFGAAESLGLPIQGVKSLYAITKGVKGYEGLTNLAKVSTTAGAFLRDGLAINGAYSEAKLEGDGEQIKMVDDLIGSYYKKNGVMPEGKDADNIYSTAQEAGFKTKLYNMPLLMVTNNVVFGKAFKGFTPKWLAEVEMTGKIPMETIKNVGWKAAKTEAYTIAPEGFKKFLIPNYWKQQPAKVVAGMLNYGKANFFEGAQESMQDMISGSIDEYYKKIYEDPSLAGAKQYWAAFKNGTASQISGQGLETFLSGFLMGGILQVPQNMFMGYVPRIRLGKAKYEEFKAAREVQTKAVVSALNDVVMNTGKYASVIEENLIHQKNLAKDMQAAEINNDHKGYLDAKNASLFSHVRTLVEHGHYDVFIDSMKEMKNWTDEELSDAFGVKKEGNINNKDVRQRLDSSIEEVEHIKKRYDIFSERFVNPFNPGKYNKDTERDAWQDETNRQKAYDDVKYHVTYANYAFEKALSRMNSIIVDMGSTKSPFANFSTNDIIPLFDRTQTRDRRKEMVDEIKTYEGGDAPQKKIAAQLTKKLEVFDELADAMDSYREYVDANRKPTAPTAEEAAHGEKVNQDITNAYLKYIKLLAAHDGKQILDDSVYPSLAGIKDYMALHKDSRSMAEYINHLHNPENFTTIFNRVHNLVSDRIKNAESIIRTSIEKFQAMGAENDGLFGRITDAGAYMDEKSVDLFQNNTKEDDDKIVFRNLDAPQSVIEKDTEKYKKVRAILDEYRAITTAEDTRTKTQKATDAAKATMTKTATMTQTQGTSGVKKGPDVTTQVPVSDIEAKKADIERRRQEELSKEEITLDSEIKDIEKRIAHREKTGKQPKELEADKEYLSLLKSSKSVEEAHDKFIESGGKNDLVQELNFNPFFQAKNKINAKYDAELAALDTANKPEPGEVVYVTLNADIESLVKNLPDKYVNGDTIIEDTTGGKKTLAQIRKIFKDLTDSGKTVVTSSKVALSGEDPIATKVLLSTDKGSIMAAFRQKKSENVEIDTTHLLEKEEAFKSKFPSRVSELPKGVSIEDILEKKRPSKEVGKQALLDRIAKSDLDSLNKLEDSITEALENNSEYLIQYGLDSRDITELMNQRREELIKHPIFASLKKGSILIMKDGTRLYIETKSKDGTPLVKKQGRDAVSKMKESDLQNIERVINPGETIPDVIVEPTSKEDKEVASENLKNQKEFLSDSTARAAANKKADTKTDKEADDDLLNSICT